MPIFATETGWVLETRTMGYALGFDRAGLLAHCYWGARLPYLGDYPAPPAPRFWSFDGTTHMTPEEYPAPGGIKFSDPALQVVFVDGVRDNVFAFGGASLRAGPNPQLDLILKDIAYPFTVTLHYRLHEAHDLIERWVTVENQGSTPVRLERVFSAKWTLPEGGDYFLTHLYGRWADEFNLQREALTVGIKTLESRRLTTSHQNSPWFAVERGGAGEEAGEIWFGALAWSGNWKLAAEVTEFGSTRINLGINDWDFAWSLAPGQSFSTPPAVAGYTQGGFGAASRCLHDYVRDTVLPHGKALHKVLYNSWEATLFDVDEQSQAALAELAAGMGVELFVMDDGWFHRRSLDNAALGDWWPDEIKFPEGLTRLIERVNGLGMEFGLWVEPEMVNVDSDLYRAHPDWVIHYPTRPRTESRQQLILNFARPDVQEAILGMLDKLLSENKIDFIKWDMNRHVSEPGWENGSGEGRELWVRYVEGVYRVWETLRARHPHIIWQSCSGGGGRADLGILRMADQIWTSDNTEATARLSIQEGYSYMLPASTMEAWVTDAGRDLVPLEFRFHASMCGVLGIGGNLLKWSPAEREQAAGLVRQYKEIRPIVQLGNLHRLISGQKGGFRALEYVSKDQSEAVLFVFRIHLPEPARLPQITLSGLQPEALYQVDGFARPRSGRAWMEDGLKLELKNLQSKLLRIRRLA